MRKFTLAALAATAAIGCAPGLSGCSTLQHLASTSGQVELSATQSLYVAEAAFKGASVSLETAVDRGALKGPAAAKARSAYDAAHAAIISARQAKAAGDAALASAKASDAMASSAQVQQLVQASAGFGQSNF